MMPSSSPTRRWLRDTIAFPPQMIRAFGGRGAVSLRDHSVTGIQWLQFTPHEQPHFRFDLRFTDLDSAVDIVDDADELWDTMSRSVTGWHPLSLNFAGIHAPGSSVGQGLTRALVLQDCHWEPNLLDRTGTFHKYVGDRLVSFLLRSQVMCDPDEDVVRYRLELQNRAGQPLRLKVRSRPRLADPLNVGYPRRDLAQHPTWWETVFDATGPDAPLWAREARFRVSVLAGLPVREDGWLLEVDAGGSTSVELELRVAGLDAPPEPSPLLGSESLHGWSGARVAFESRRRKVFDALPTLESDDPRLSQLYNACIGTLVESTWHRGDFILEPFYSAGTWLFVLAWDVSFSAKALSLIDPAAIRLTLIELIRCGLGAHSYIGWDGSRGAHYSYSLIAGINAVRDYISVTGDVGILEAAAGESTVGARLASDLRSAHYDRSRADHLLAYGDSTKNFLENRTDGYQGATAVINIQTVDVSRWLASQGWPSLTDDESERLAQAAETLWDEAAGWYATAVAPDKHELVSTYQVFELLWSESLAPERKEALAARLKEGEFLGPHGMYSIARSDTVHWDRYDADWGGGGQYTGMPLRIAEALWRCKLPDAAWRIFEGCLSWPSAFPYLPQEIMTDSLATLDVEQAAEIAVGAGVQAVVFGLFGINPQADGRLVVAPSPPLSRARLTGYRHRDTRLDVLLEDVGWTVTWRNEEYTGTYHEHLRVDAGTGHATIASGSP